MYRPNMYRPLFSGHSIRYHVSIMTRHPAYPRPRRLYWSALLLLCRAPSALAVEEPGPDAAGVGRAGATAAAQDVPGALTMNPALVPPPRESGLRLTAGLRLDARQVTTRRWGDPASRRAEAPLEPKVLTHMVVQAPLGVLNLWASAWFRQREDHETWFPGQDPDSPLVPGAHDRQRYGALRYHLWENEYGLAMAWHPRPWLSVGAAAVGRSLNLEHERMLWAGTHEIFQANPESTEDDLRVRVTLRAPFVPEGRLGVFLRPVPPLRLGLSFAQPQTTVTLRGRAALQPTSQILTRVGESDAALRLRLPFSLRAALGVDVGRVSVDAQITVTQAPRPRAPLVRTSGLVISRPESPTVFFPVEEVGLGYVVRRRVSLATGLRVVAVKPWLELSLGYAFWQGAQDPAHHSAALVDLDSHAITAGITLRHGRVRLDVGYGRIHAASRGGPGEARQWNPVDAASASSISAGRQSRSGDLGAATLTLDLDWRK